MKIKAKALPYGFDSLEPFIPEDVMIRHYDKHYITYIDNACLVAKNNNLEFSSVDEAISWAITEKSVNNSSIEFFMFNLMQVKNHELFWESLSPKKSPSEECLCKISSSFGSFEKFRELFIKSCSSHIGSGYLFLLRDPNARGGIRVQTTNNGENYFKDENVIICIDLWEHSYYVRYNKSDYIRNVFEVINWSRF